MRKVVVLDWDTYCNNYDVGEKMDEENKGRELSPAEREYVRSARENSREIYALEAYSRLWDSLEGRLGKNNELLKRYVSEYNGRNFEPPLDRVEDKRVQMMRATFYLPRVGMPADVILALLLYR